MLKLANARSVHYLVRSNETVLVYGKWHPLRHTSRRINWSSCFVWKQLRSFSNPMDQLRGLIIMNNRKKRKIKTKTVKWELLDCEQITTDINWTQGKLNGKWHQTPASAYMTPRSKTGCLIICGAENLKGFKSLTSQRRFSIWGFCFRRC